MKHHLALVLLAGCTSLGPMPTTTAVSAVPVGRPGAEVTGAILPIYRLSDAVRGEDRNGDTVPSVGAVFEPDRLLELPGVIIGGRAWGKQGDLGIEPVLGYRKQYGKVALAGVGFGTRMSGSENGASYRATRVGGEVIADVEVLRLASWAAIHAGGSVQATVLEARGRYCVDEDGDGRDCAEDGTVPMIEGEVSGVYPAATVHAGLDLGRLDNGVFHSARIAGMFSAGHMPRLVGGRERWGDQYITGGVLLTLGFGARD